MAFLNIPLRLKKIDKKILAAVSAVSSCFFFQFLCLDEEKLIPKFYGNSFSPELASALVPIIDQNPVSPMSSIFSRKTARVRTSTDKSLVDTIRQIPFPKSLLRESFIAVPII